MTDQATTETKTADTASTDTKATTQGADTSTKSAKATDKATETKAAKTEEASEYDWRGAMAGEDTKFRKQLDRYTDPQAFGKSWLEKEKVAADPRRLMIPGEDATDEDRAAYAKARGIGEPA